MIQNKSRRGRHPNLLQCQQLQEPHYSHFTTDDTPLDLFSFRLDFLVSPGAQRLEAQLSCYYYNRAESNKSCITPVDDRQHSLQAPFALALGIISTQS
jgi:hypothetical protein